MLSQHFSRDELIESDAARRLGLDNTPPPEVESHLRMLVVILERVRTLLSVPVLVSSGYRAPAVNQAVGGSATSAHCLGLAADFRAPQFGSPADVARAIATSNIIGDLDQLIYEHTWVHVGLARPGTMPRQAIMTLVPGSKPAAYTLGIKEYLA